jgi:4-amino-4-deoxy-L-arabinose transferase-like glycosyltransferase
MPHALLIKSTLRRFFFPTVIGCVWIFMAALVNPLGDFPLNDDWCYGRTVHSLVEQGSLRFLDWGAPTLIAQAIWGTAFCVPFGFSFTALRISTLTLGLVGVLATYFLLKKTGGGEMKALIGTLLLAANPLFFPLANTFMTDVPFYACAFLSLLLFVHGLDREKKSFIITGTIFSVASILIRQIGIIIPLAFAIACIARKGLSKKTLFSAVTPALCVLAVYFAYQKILEGTIGLPSASIEKPDMLLNSLMHPTFGMFDSFIKRIVEAFLYLGLFLLPLLILKITSQWSSLRTRTKVIIPVVYSGIFLFTMGALLSYDHLMPAVSGIFYETGLGPPTLRDVYILKLPHLPTATKSLRLGVTFASVMGAILLAGNIISLIIRLVVFRNVPEKSVTNKWFGIFVLFAGAIYLLLLGITGFFDRYLIFFLPLFIVALILPAYKPSPPPGKTTLALVWILLAVFMFFTLASTHDYLSWNKARWRALDYLVIENNISPKNIDGGFEFNGWHNYGNTEYRWSENKSWWWVIRDDYLVAFGPVNRYTEIKSFPYRRWLPPGRASILVLRKQNIAPPPASP